MSAPGNAVKLGTVQCTQPHTDSKKLSVPRRDQTCNACQQYYESAH